jgi:PAS domain S-box-containing protein
MPRILVADDEPDLAFLLRVMLEAAGYEVESAADGRSAIEAVRTGSPDLLVLDAMMPGVDGWDVLAAVRSDPATAELPVVMLTALSSDADRRRAEEHGVVVYMTKPFNRDALAGAIEEALARSRTDTADGDDAAEAPTAQPAAVPPDVLAAIEAQLDVLGGTIDDAVIGLDAVGRVVSWNPGAERIIGWPADEAVGKQLRDTVVLPDEALRDSMRREVLAGRAVRHVSVPCLRRDGTRIDLVLSIVPVMPPGQPGPAAWLVARDLTTKRWAEARFRSIIEAAPDAVVIVNAAGRIEFVNAQTERQFGYRAKELLGRPVELLIPHRFRTIHQDHRAGYTANPHTRPMGAGLDLFGQRQDGTEFPVEIGLSPVTTEDGQLFYAAVRDISERRALEQAVAVAHEAMVQSERLAALGEMASVVSHELRSPLSAILNAVFLVRQALGEEVPPAVERQLSLIERESSQAASIASDLVAFTRPRQPALAEVALGPVVAEVLEVLPPPAGVDVRTEGMGIRVLADRVHLAELFANLVSNAYDAMGTGGVLHIRAEADGDMAVVEVADTGTGIDPGIGERVFEPFATTKSHGTGLGLAIVQRIVDAHEGWVRLGNRPGDGASVVFGLRRPTRGRLLVVDDDEAMRCTAAEMLAEAGFDVETAAGGAEALALLGEDRTDAMVLDLRMPTVDGQTVLREMPRPDLPVVVVTGERVDTALLGSLPPNVRTVLQKPVAPVLLLKAVTECLTTAATSSAGVRAAASEGSAPCA